MGMIVRQKNKRRFLGDCLTGLIVIVPILASAAGPPDSPLLRAQEHNPASSLPSAPGSKADSKLPDRPDLVVTSIEIDPEGFVMYKVRNRGHASTDKSFIVAVYIDGVKKGQVLHNPLEGQTEDIRNAREARIPPCRPFSVTAAVDSLNWVAEAAENNNLGKASYPGFCPDITASIRQDLMDLDTRYRSKITVKNEGNGPMPEVSVSTIVVPDTHWPGGNPPTPQQCISDPNQPCERDNRKVGPLLPGQKDSFHVGKKRLRSTTLFVQVNISCTLFPPEQCAEKNIQNNVVKRVLGPH